MKAVISVLLIILVLSSCINTTGKNEQPIVKQDEPQKAGIISLNANEVNNLRVGDLRELTYEENVSIECYWYFQFTGDTTVKVISDEYAADNVDAEGAGEKRTLKMSAIAPGNTQIVMEYKSGPDDSPIQTITYNISVTGEIPSLNTIINNDKYLAEKLYYGQRLRIHSTMKVKKGQTLYIALPKQDSGSKKWILEIDGEDLVKLIYEDSVRENASSYIPDTDVYYFETLKVGKCVIKMNLTAESGSIERTCPYTIIIEE
jgi:predicted secreted protein